MLIFALAGMLAGCAALVGDYQFDRCHRYERQRDTINLEIFCRQTP